MSTTDRDLRAAPLLKARLRSLGAIESVTVGDEHGTDWEVVSVDDRGRVLTGQTIYVDGEAGAAEVMDGLDPSWDQG